MNIFLATFLGCMLAIAVAAQAFRVYTHFVMRRMRAQWKDPTGVMKPIEYPAIDPEDLKTIMIGEMLDRHQIALRKACGCKLCTPFVNLVMPSPSISEQPLAPPAQGPHS